MKTNEILRKVVLTGNRHITFDRYAGDNRTELPTDQRLYLMAGNVICLPSLNIMSLLSAENTPSAPKRFLDARQYKKVAAAIRSFVTISEFEIPFLRDGKPIVFGVFGEDGVDKLSGCYISRSVARLEKGIPHPKVRPVLPTPWELRFTLEISANEEVSEDMIQNLLVRSGPAIGLGTFRGVYGKFRVTTWE